MATDYLEKYVESVTDLPAQLQRMFRLIRDLDEKSAKLQVRDILLQWTLLVASCGTPYPAVHAASLTTTHVCRETSMTSAASS
jgi:hypothetical protein